jgi:serine/threonine protein kinase
MPSDSVESFLDLARENRLLPTDQVQDLVRQSAVPQENLPALCEALVARGLLTPFQSARIREGRGRELSFAGYPILDDRGPCPGGFELTAKHPSLRTPIVLRRIDTEWLAPADNLSAFVQRAQHASTITHRHLKTLLDAGAYEDQLFVVLEPYEGATLEQLVRDIGPMPAFLACQFVRQAAQGLEAAHRSGHAHGDVRPGVLYVAPLAQSNRLKADGTPLFRPAPTAAVKVAEFGLVPRRPAMTAWPAANDLPPDRLTYLPPERAAAGDATVAGDVYGLGLTLSFLLTGRPPFQAKTAAEMLTNVTAGGPLPLPLLRPDLPPELVNLVGGMIAKDPDLRPSMAVVIDRLARFIAPAAAAPPAPVGPKPAESSILGPEPPTLLTNAAPVVAQPIPPELVTEKPIDLAPVALPSEWDVQPFHGSTGDGEHMLAPAAEVQPDSSASGDLSDFSRATTRPVTRRRGMTAEEARQQKKQWGLIAAGLWLLSIPLWFILLNTYGCFDGKKPDPEPPVKKGKK